MNHYKNKYLIIFMIILCISIGFAYISSNLSITGHGIFAKNTWDIYFENLVDDYNKTEISIPANIENKTTINFSVNLEEPGSSYIFYSDIVNNGTIDAMLDTLEVTGLEEVESFLTAKVSYSDDIEINKFDLLSANSKDKIKVSVKYRDDINPEDLPTTAGNINLSVSLDYLQADENAKERQHNEDIKPPTIKFVANNEVKGNNNWYKSLSVTTKLLDSSPIKSVKYCVTTNDTCTPNTSAEVENNTFTYQLLNNAGVQTICIEATDNLDNVSTTCSKEEYKVDGVDPTISNVTVTPDDDTMRIEVVGEDDSSGVAAYYYSKDSGTTYVKSKNSNYTFTNLDEGDYLIVVYVEDKAGNTSLTSTGTTTIRHKDWCNHNGITNLSECAIATEAKNSNVEEAKNTIMAKETPDFSKTSPSTLYESITTNTLSTVNVRRYRPAVGTGVEFDTNKGMYKLINPTYKELTSLDLENNDYYMCSDQALVANCTTVYKIKSFSTYTEESTGTLIYAVDKYNLSFKIKSYDTSNVGMYAANDESGTSYYYRGNTGGNYVKFGDNYWRIIRINGDGSLRLIYYGTSSLTKGKSPFNSYFNDEMWDPTFIGFKYNDIDFSKSIIESGDSDYSKIIETTKYYYSKGYSYDTENKVFKLDTTEGNIIYGTYKSLYNNLLNDGYVYSCFSTTAEDGCKTLKKITGYYGPTQSKVHYLSYGSTSYENATKNNTNSTILEKLNSWYENNILNKTNSEGNSLANYVVDEDFCNDRSLFSGNGYSLNSHTIYGAQNRIATEKSPSLICPQKNDIFSVDEKKGNGTLQYPIGLITADEASMAGATEAYMNYLFYLVNYSNIGGILTISPGIFHETRNDVYMLTIGSDGRLTSSWAGYQKNILPVINIDPTKFTFTGTGTAEDPFVVE